jgi:SAM dependent carboxyl methyltransferase
MERYTRELAAPNPMEGGGVYNRDSQVQGSGSSPGLVLFERAAELAVLPATRQPIVIADYGCSEGRNSLAPIGTAIAQLRRRGGETRPISVVHNDVADNDWTVLFETLANDPHGYLRANADVFASAVGSSFYGQVLPSESVTLGWSAWSVQWLSRTPGPIPDQVQVAGSRDPAAHAAFANQSAQDWVDFLTSRANEMHPGGQLVVVTMALDANGEFGYDSLLADLYAAILEMVESGFIRTDEAQRMVIPTVGRSRADFLAPFADSGTFAGLTMEELEIFAGEDRIWNDFERDGDAQQFGARWAAFSRASVFPSLASALDGGTSDPRASAFIVQLESNLAARIATGPKPTNIPLARMRIGKN